MSKIRDFFDKKIKSLLKINKIDYSKLKGKSLLLSNSAISNFYFRYLGGNNNILEKTEDFVLMFQDPIIFNALELMVDDGTQYSPITRKIVWTSVKNKSQQKILDSLFGEMDIDGDCWRNAAKLGLFGNCPLRVYYKNPDFSGGVVNIELEDNIFRYIPIELNGVLIKYIDKYTDDLLEPFEILFGRINTISNTGFTDNYYDVTVKQNNTEKNVVKNTFRYGTSLFENVRRIWRQLKLLEDNMILTRLDRTPIVRLYKVRTEGMTSETAIDMIDFYSNLVNTGDRMLSVNDDLLKATHGQVGFGTNIMLPVEEKGDIEVEEFGGEADVNHIVDVDYFKNKFYAALKIPKEFLGMCLRGNTKIRLLNGHNVDIKTMYENNDEYIGKNVFVCSEEGDIDVAPIKNVCMNRLNANFVRVHLDTGEYIDATPDHKFMLRNGSYKEAQDLKSNDSLMPLYIKGKRYLKFKNNHKIYHGWRCIHRFIGEKKHGNDIPKYYAVHHCDRNPHNNELENLKILSAVEHMKEHNIDSVKIWIEAGKKSRNKPSNKEKKKNAKCIYCFTKENLKIDKYDRIYNVCVDCYSKLLSDANKGKKRSIEACKNISNALRDNENVRGWTNINSLDYVIEKQKISMKKYFKSKRFIVSKGYRLKKIRENRKNNPEKYDIIHKKVGKTRKKNNGTMKFVLCCFNCKKEFEVEVSRFAREKDKTYFDRPHYCSKHCAVIVNNKKRYNKKEYAFICINCGKEYFKNFTEYKYKIYSEKYFFCSPSCNALYRNKLGLAFNKSKNTQFKELVNYNHRVIKIENLGVIENAYDIEIDSPFHNFALSSGIFVHNSDEGFGISIGETSLKRKEIRYARTIKKLQFALIKMYKDLAYFHLMSLKEDVEYNDINILMNVVSTAEDEEFKSALENSMDNVGSFVDLVNDLKDLFDDTELDEKSRDYLLDYITTRILNMNDFNWKEFFKSMFDNTNEDEISVEESRKMLVTMKSPKMLEVFKKFNENTSKSIIPNFNFDRNLRYCKKSFIGKDKRFFVEKTKQKLDIAEIKNIVNKTTAFDISIFNLRYENFNIDIDSYSVSGNKNKKNIKTEELVFIENVFNINQILNTTSENPDIFEVNGKYYINYSNGCKLFKNIIENSTSTKIYNIVTLEKRKK